MVTTVVYPDAGCDPNWDSQCSNPGCFGVPLYRLYQTGSEKGKAPEFIRMAGMNICQRQTMTVNHGLYYVDLTASPKTQNAWPGQPGTPPTKATKCMSAKGLNRRQTSNSFA
jgi:hypothetical protein